MLSTNWTLHALILITIILVAHSGIVRCSCYFEQKELEGKDLKELVNNFQNKIHLDQQNNMCFREDSKEELATLRRRKLEAEVDTSGFLEDLAARVAEPRPTSLIPAAGSTGFSLHRKPENIGEDFDILRIMKVVEERKNATKVTKMFKQPSSCGGVPPPLPAKQNQTTEKGRCTTCIPPYSAIPTTRAPPRVLDITSKCPDVYYKEEGLKNLLDAFLPLLRGKNVSDLQKLEANLMREMNETELAGLTGQSIRARKPSTVPLRPGSRRPEMLTAMRGKAPTGKPGAQVWPKRGPAPGPAAPLPDISSFADDRERAAMAGEGTTFGSVPKSKQDKPGFFSFLGNFWKKGVPPDKSGMPPQRKGSSGRSQNVGDLYRFLSGEEMPPPDIKPSSSALR